MSWLIDGYNLMYAMGVLQGRKSPTGLKYARNRLLDLLRGAYGEESSQVTVVFDASDSPPGAAEELEYQGLHIRFAVREPEADDLIEDLIQHESVPRRLTVVSDDHRIQQAARRRQCEVLGCGAYLDWLADHRRPQRPPPEPVGRTEGVPVPDTDHWLREFGDIEADPEFKEFFEDFGAKDVDS
jgi:predicted RNA-binding protein with PIN domain